MRLILIIVIVVLFAALLNFVRAEVDTPLLQSLPLLGGHTPGGYDVAATALLLISAWGVWRCFRKDR